MDSIPETARGQWIRENMPNAREGDCRFTSRCTLDYNCVGFVAGDFRWWQWEDRDDFYWPDNVRRDHWARTYVEALKTARFVECASVDPEDGFEKIVIYHRGGVFKHVALVTADGTWKSKLGDLEDLEHPHDALDGSAYGSVFAFMKRELKYAGPPLPGEYRL